MHPAIPLAHAYHEKQITRNELRTRANLLRHSHPQSPIKKFHGNESEGVPLDLIADLIRDRKNTSGRELAERAASILNRNLPANIQPSSGESIYRNLNHILAEDGDNVSLRIADAILLALDLNLNDTDLPCLAITKPGAIEQVDSHIEAKNLELSPLERKRLIRQLQRFCIGFFNGPRFAGEPRAFKRTIQIEHETTLTRRRKAKNEATKRKYWKEKKARQRQHTKVRKRERAYARKYYHETKAGA